jgi:glycolate oxidase FAD binding subunit
MERDAASVFWQDVRDHRHEFFAIGAEELARGVGLWRLSVPPTAPRVSFPGRQFIEWGGAQRWWRTTAAPDAVRAAAAAAGGHATWVRAAAKPGGAFAPVSDVLMRIHRSLKSAFDPDRILNPGRLYAEL